MLLTSILYRSREAEMSELIVNNGTIERMCPSVSKTGVHIHNVILRQSDSKLFLNTSYDVLKQKVSKFQKTA